MHVWQRSWTRRGICKSSSNLSAENSSPTSTGGRWNRSRRYDGQPSGRMACTGPIPPATGKWRRSGGSSTRRSNGECWRGIPPPGSNPCRSLGDGPGFSPSKRRNAYWNHLRGICGPSSSAPSKRECGRGGILSLRWSDVDMKTRTIYLGKTKNGESRHVPISSRLFSVLSGLPRRLGSDHVFTWEPKIRKTGIPFHDVRTSFENASRMGRGGRGVPISRSQAHRSLPFGHGRSTSQDGR